MKLPEYERITFKKSPLKLVLGQIHFTTLLRFEQNSFIANFQEAIRDEYPKIARETGVTLQISPMGLSQSTKETLWRLSSRDNLWSVVFSESSLTLESREHFPIQRFLGRFKKVLEAAKDSLDISDCLRLGLRFVNEFRYPEADDIADWRSLLNPEFACFEASGLLDGQIGYMFQDVQVKRPDGILAIRHGLLDGFMIPPLPQQESVTGRFYLLDLDYYDMTECELEVPVILEQLRDYNDIMYRFFRWTLGTKLYSYLEPLNAKQS
jgi:uncharacterized protein (TIGR04255 family)